MKHKQQKSVQSLFDDADKERKKSVELQKIREERKKLEEEEKIKKPVKRTIEITEYEDGTFSFDGLAWKLPIEKQEIQEAFYDWLDGSLEQGKPILFQKEFSPDELKNQEDD